MESSPSRRDSSRHRDYGRGAEWPVGSSERRLCRRSGFGEGENGSQHDALIKAVVNDFGAAEGSAARDGLKNRFRQSKPAEMKEACIATLRQAAAIVDTKAPSDAAAYKAWLQQISEHVAEASKEGGFLGIGGVKVSDAEKATLTEISSALKAA